MVKHLSLIAHTFYATEFDFPKALRKEEIVGRYCKLLSTISR